MLSIAVFCTASPLQLDLSVRQLEHKIRYCVEISSLFHFQLIVASTFLALLQRDHLLLKSYSKHNNVTPTVCLVYVTLTVSTCCFSSFWTSEKLWSQIVALLEIICAMVTSPNIYVLGTILWCDRFYISDRTVVALTPLYMVLLLTGSSLRALALCIVGSLAGYSLMFSKLPLER